MIYLSFDIEEFDMPFEYERSISFEEQMSISITGTTMILDILEKHQLKATFFSTVIFAQNAPKIIERLLANGHELASHNYYHSKFEIPDLEKSRIELERISNKKVYGFRMPRMYPVDDAELVKAGYTYNSSLNPTYLPGRYNHFRKPKTIFKENNLWQIPASVTPIIRFPLFWLSFHNLPIKLYLWLSKWTIKNDGYLNIYFHPWEFTDLDQKEKFNFPTYISRNTGQKMSNRLEKFILWAKHNKYHFDTLNNLTASI